MLPERLIMFAKLVRGRTAKANHWGGKRRKTHHQEDNALFIQCHEDSEMHTRWKEATLGRPAIELPEDELKRLVQHGMPMKYRLGLWSKFFLASKQHRRYSIEMCDLGMLQDLAPDDAVIRIAQDLPRTQPGQLSEGQLLSLKRILSAYAGWNPTVAYCQGMNFMAAIFVKLGFTEAEALMGMRYLVEDICQDTHAADLSGYHRDAEVLDRLVQRFLPSLHANLQRHNVPISLLAMDHFISVASRTWPLEATIRLWDVIFVEGPEALFASFLALLDLFLPKADQPYEDDVAAFDIMESFKVETACGIRSRPDAFFTNMYQHLRLFPKGLINDLRAEVMAQK